MKSVLVIFGKDLPKKNKKWFKQFDEILGPKELSKLVNSGSVQRAYELVNKISRMTLADGSRLSKLINYQGYELWWMHYDDIYYKFCLPYTQYQPLLSYLKDFERVYLFQPPWPHLFQYFLRAHHRQCIILSKFLLRNLLPMPFGIFIQIIISLCFLPWLAIIRPKLVLRTSDKFAPPHKCDFRMILMYQELRERKIPFVEFIRSIEPWFTVISHVWQRRRLVFYSTAVIGLIFYLSGLFNKKFENELWFKGVKDPEEYFWRQTALHYIKNFREDIWAIQAMKHIFKLIGIKAAYIAASSNRSFHEVLACKLAGINLVGIQHGAAPKYYFVSDFMPDFDGEKKMSVDHYGLWSDWWREYYIKNSQAYTSEQLYISGPMRPLKIGASPFERSGPLKVLFISETLASPNEIMPYLQALLQAKDFELYFKFRPYKDNFEFWLKENQLEIYKKILEKIKIFRGTTQEAISQSDVVVGSHSTAVLEALLLLKPFVFFWTDKWGDYFEIKSFGGRGCFFAKNPRELVDFIKKSPNTSKEELKQLQERFFGNPYQDGSKWVIDRLEEYLRGNSGLSK